MGKETHKAKFKIFLELLKDISKEEVKSVNNIPDEEIPDKFNFLRVGNMLFPEQLKNGVISNIMKHITSSNFIFHVFIFEEEIGIDDFSFLLEKYFLAIRTKNLVYLDPDKNEAQLIASDRSIIDILMSTFEGNESFIDRASKFLNKK